MYIIISFRSFYVQIHGKYIRQNDQSSPILIIHQQDKYPQLLSYRTPLLSNIQHVYNMLLVTPIKSTPQKSLPTYLIYEVSQFCNHGVDIAKSINSWTQVSGFWKPLTFPTSFKNSLFGAQLTLGCNIPFPYWYFPSDYNNGNLNGIDHQLVR